MPDFNAMSQAPTLRKPAYLISLEKEATFPKEKVQSYQRFISLDKPRIENNVVEVKGFFSDKKEEEIIKNFTDIIANTSREYQLEMIFPLHRISSIRSLVFNAVKNITPVTPGN